MRLIDADAIHYCNYDLDNYHSFRAVDEEEIAEMPTIDAMLVVRAKPVAISSHIHYEDTLIRMDSQCPICGALMLRVDSFCPNCGAMMN